MNFYTLTSKGKVILSLLLVLLAMVALDMVLNYYVMMQTSKSSYIDHKHSRLEHYTLNNQDKVNDIIFVGSSTTYYHISSNQFKKQGLKTYNLGIKGGYLGDYPEVIETIINSKVKPKKVIFELPVHIFYKELLIATNPSMVELKTYSKVDMGKTLTVGVKWLTNLHSFLIYSEAILSKITSSYSKFDHQTAAANDKAAKENTPDDRDYLKTADCDYFAFELLSEGYSSVKCTNGGGILFGQIIADIPKKKQEKNIPSKFYAENTIFLNLLIERLKAANIEVAITLVPLQGGKVNYDLTEIQKQLKDTKIIDLTNMKFEDYMWSDGVHLNQFGREKYTDRLISILK